MITNHSPSETEDWKKKWKQREGEFNFFILQLDNDKYTLLFFFLQK